RQAFFMGVPLDAPTLTRTEIEALNGIRESLEVPSRRWQARVLRDQAGGEILYISVPYTSFDDLRGLGGLLNVINTIATEGKRPDTNDVIADRLAKAEELIAKLQASQVAESAPA